MLRNLFAGVVLAALPVFASAVVLTVEYDVSINTAYNYALATYQPIEPIVGGGSFTFDLGYREAQYAAGTIKAMAFGHVSDGLGLISPSAGRLPFDPTSLYRLPDDTRLYASVTDTPTTSSMTMMANVSAFDYDQNGLITYNWALFWTDYLAPGAGDGISTYLFSAQDVIDAFRNISISGAPVTFKETYTGGGYTSGMSWIDTNARIGRVLVDGKDITQPAASVPTPATFALLLPGLMLIGATTRRRKAASGVAR